MMEPILLKAGLTPEDIDMLILRGINDMDISQDKRDEIQEASQHLSGSFAKAINYHMLHGENPDASYAFRIAVEFGAFIEEYRSVFNAQKKDLLVAFGVSAVWMSIMNGLDAESGIMPSHPFKREIANTIRSITEILDEKKHS